MPYMEIGRYSVIGGPYFPAKHGYSVVFRNPCDDGSNLYYQLIPDEISCLMPIRHARKAEYNPLGSDFYGYSFTDSVSKYSMLVSDFMSSLSVHTKQDDDFLSSLGIRRDTDDYYYGDDVRKLLESSSVCVSSFPKDGMIEVKIEQIDDAMKDKLRLLLSCVADPYIIEL